jgi:hypothetical protein
VRINVNIPDTEISYFPRTAEGPTQIPQSRITSTQNQAGRYTDFSPCTADADAVMTQQCVLSASETENSDADRCSDARGKQ